ncbi:uncharacterized protein LOC119317725 isoform X2 [Triticum dicoccoides]|uniref:uncharacterized protein LOC119317725 isoform X2 n=1 Tax=Triticum dicoccoides TaxID=85692 RepID=UPI00188E841E|nr:uncharacterized protein LOC119317725 isoform X2 [Triticum dicoccoides]
MHEEEEEDQAVARPPDPRRVGGQQWRVDQIESDPDGGEGTGRRVQAAQAWGIGEMAANRVSLIDLDMAMAAHARGGGERPSGATHVERPECVMCTSKVCFHLAREELEPQRWSTAPWPSSLAGGACAAETAGSVQPSRCCPSTLGRPADSRSSSRMKTEAS